MILTALFLDERKVKITFDDIRQKSNSTTNKKIRFTEKSYFYTFLGYTQSHSGVLGDIEGFVQLIPASYNSDKPNNLTGVDKFLLKSNCIIGSIVNGV